MPDRHKDWKDWTDKQNPYDLSAITQKKKNKRKRIWVDWNDKSDPYDAGTEKRK